MAKDLTNSKIDRQNILNNNYAISEIEKACNIEGVLFEDKIAFTKEQVAQFYEIDVRTLERYLEVYGDEFKSNGYDILKGKRLKEFIKKYNEKVTDINVGELASSIPSLAIFDFRAFLNVGMLLVESEKAKKIGNQSPKRYAGYIVLKGVANSLTFFEKAVRALSNERPFQYDVYNLMMALVYARATFPASKKKTHEDIIPLLFEKVDESSYSQILSCCEYIGSEYDKFISYLTTSIKKTYGINSSETYFDCTNFYFEIDKIS